MYHVRQVEYAQAFSLVFYFYFVLMFTAIKNLYTIFIKVRRATESFWVVNM